MEITLEKVLEFRKKIYEESVSIIAKKGADYNKKQQAGGDTLFNMRVSTILGITDNPCQSVLVRLSDKFMRLNSLTANPKDNPQVKDESVEDTVKDIHNYLDYLLLFYQEIRSENT